MSDIEYYLNGDYGDVLYNGKTVAIIKLDSIRYLKNSNYELYKKIYNTGSYDDFFFFMSKTLFEYSILVHRNPGSKTNVYNYGNAEKIDFEMLFERFPEVAKKVNLFDIGFPTVKNLIYKYCNNDPTVGAHSIYQEEPLIDKINENKNDKNKSLVYIKFDNNEDYWKLFPYKEYDITTMNDAFSSYGGSLVDSSNYAWEDWKEGYFMYTFDLENLKKIKEIFTYINPSLNEKLVITNNRLEFEERDAKEILDFLYDNFTRKCDDIMEKCAEINDQAHAEDLQSDIEKENSDFFEEYDILKLTSFYKYYTTMGKLLKLYDAVPNSDYMSLYEVMSHLGEQLNVTEDFMEDIYGNGPQAYNFNSAEFNKYAAEKLDEIIEEIQDEWVFEDKEEYVKILEFFKKKGFPMNIDITHPTKKDRKFKILGIDPQTNKIKLELYMDNTRKKQDWTFEEFSNYLYHPELFESRKFGKRKI